MQDRQSATTFSPIKVDRQLISLRCAAAAMILLLAAAGAGLPQSSGIKYTITGRVVDKSGLPVPNATLYFQPEGGSGCMIMSYGADESGRFSIEVTAWSEQSDWIMTVIDNASTPEKSVRLLGYPLSSAAVTDFAPEMAGRKVQLAETRRLDVGDVTAQLTYRSVLLHLQNKERQPISLDGADTRLYLTLRDPRGDVITQTGSSRNDQEGRGSSVLVALPTGKWSLDVAYDALIATIELDLKPSAEPLEETVTVVENKDGFETEKFRKRLDSVTARERLAELRTPYTEGAFFERVKKGNAQATRLFLDAGMNPDVFDEEGATPLMRALSDRQTTVSYILLGGGADVNARSRPYDQTPLMYLSSYSAPELAQALIDCGADVNARSIGGGTPLTHLVFGENVDLVKTLLVAGAKVNVRTALAETPLLLASKAGGDEIVQLLLQWGAKVNAKNEKGNTPLLEAVAANNDDVVKTLLAWGADPNAANSSGITPAMHAAMWNETDMIELLEGSGAIINKDVLLAKAVLATDLQQVQALLKAGANPNVKSLDGWTPLMRAAQDGNLALAKLLVAGGADLEAKDAEGSTPLIYAASYGHVEVVRFLAGKGAQVNARNNQGETALMHIAYESEKLETAKTLIELGADVNALDKEGRSALKRSNNGEAMSKLLRKAGARE